MIAQNQEYMADQEIVEFFNKTSTSRSACDARAQELVGGDVRPVAVQGSCSYTVYAGTSQEFVVQFRPKSLELNSTMICAIKMAYGDLVPSVNSHDPIGEDDIDGKEPLCAYVFSRMNGVSHLDFILAHDLPENSPEFCKWRENLISDIARFFVQTWRAPMARDLNYRKSLHQKYEKDLRRLLAALPDRFHRIIQRCIDNLRDVTALPMVLLHTDLRMCNVMVDPDDNHLVGVIDWAETEVGPFGMNLHFLQQFMSNYRLGVGWIRYGNYDTLDKIFWDTFSEEAGVEGDVIEWIKTAMVVGLLLSEGFTNRLANMPEPEPIRDDESEAYNMLSLDSLLIDPATRLVDY